MVVRPGAIFVRSLGLMRGNWVLAVPIVLLLIVLAATEALSFALLHAELEHPGASPGMFGLNLLPSVVQDLLSLLLSAMLYAMCAAVWRGERASLARGWATAKGSWCRLFLLALLIAVAAIIPLLTTIVFVFVAAHQASSAGGAPVQISPQLFVGRFAPAIMADFLFLLIVAFFTFYAQVAIVVDRLGPVRGLVTSVRLVVRHAGATLLLLLILLGVNVAIGVTSAIVALPAAFGTAAILKAFEVNMGVFPVTSVVWMVAWPLSLLKQGMTGVFPVRSVTWIVAAGAAIILAAPILQLAVVGQYLSLASGARDRPTGETVPARRFFSLRRASLAMLAGLILYHAFVGGYMAKACSPTNNPFTGVIWAIMLNFALWPYVLPGAAAIFALSFLIGPPLTKPLARWAAWLIWPAAIILYMVGQSTIAPASISGGCAF